MICVQFRDGYEGDCWLQMPSDFTKLYENSRYGRHLNLEDLPLKIHRSSWHTAVPKGDDFVSGCLRCRAPDTPEIFETLDHHAHFLPCASLHYF